VIGTTYARREARPLAYLNSNFVTHPNPPPREMPASRSAEIGSCGVFGVTVLDVSECASLRPLWGTA